ncbi:amine dehydrogenase (plasmid) [Cupriavidus pinatubonensis]|uniref:amine dehydrogenase large subunit n=1 Tax=Cupriavidus pinatubonensis TaxID=248026 RepID=UPI001C739883|nr:amine dehydrogenase large subunit [Cupriavidus pinatubonensis]QYY33534.1 amine dehydrogenase [Cupriavidus pinatubonensis]
MRIPHLRPFVVACLAALAASAGSATVYGAAPLQPETLSVQPMPPRGDHFLYALEMSAPIDARLTVYDIDKKKVVAQQGAGFLPGVTRSADHRFTYVATSYFSRGTTGERTDVLEITDNASFRKVGEVVLPAKHAQQVPSLFNTTVSDDGGFVYVTNITPATSVSVVNLATRKLAGEIDTAACVLTYPSGRNRFASLCQSGKALIVTLDQDGREVGREQSAAFIDVENDPVYTHAARWGSGYLFVTFSGKVTPADFSASPARFDAPWQLVSPAEARQGWRPGGLQPFAASEATGKLYVLMHQGGEGSHKEPGTEIWVFDVGSHARVARWKLAAEKLMPMVTLSVSEGGNPIVYGSTYLGVQAFDAASGKPVHADKTLGRAVVQMFPF